MVPGFNGQAVGMPAHLFLEPVGDGLLDIFLLELDERPRRVETSIPDSLLFWWKAAYVTGQIKNL